MQPFMPELLENLNEAERRVLRLLAEGHTIKSAANLIGSTPAAVNERLREARRKTGVGSSRELARQLSAQENRDKRSEVATPHEPHSKGLHNKTLFWLSGRGVIIVFTVALGLVAVAASLTSQSPLPSSTDPIIGQALPDGPTAAEWQALLAEEDRDPNWAPRAEQALRDRYEKIAYVGGPDNPLRVRCAKSICEVAGTINPPRSEAPVSDGEKSSTGQAMRDLQAKELWDDLQLVGLKSESTLFTATNTKPRRTAFFAYFTRLDT